MKLCYIVVSLHTTLELFFLKLLFLFLASSAKKSASLTAEKQRSEASERLANMAENSAVGLKLTESMADVLKSMAQSMSRMADAMEGMEKTTKEMAKNVVAIAAKILENKST